MSETLRAARRTPSVPLFLQLEGVVLSGFVPTVTMTDARDPTRVLDPASLAMVPAPLTGPAPSAPLTGVARGLYAYALPLAQVTGLTAGDVLKLAFLANGHTDTDYLYVYDDLQPLVPGTVTLSADGTPEGTDLARTVYDQLVAEATARGLLLDPAHPPPDWQAAIAAGATTADKARATLQRARLADLKTYAATAQGTALALSTYFNALEGLSLPPSSG